MPLYKSEIKLNGSYVIFPLLVAFKKTNSKMSQIQKSEQMKGLAVISWIVYAAVELKYMCDLLWYYI